MKNPKFPTGSKALVRANHHSGPLERNGQIGQVTSFAGSFLYILTFDTPDREGNLEGQYYVDTLRPS